MSTIINSVQIVCNAQRGVIATVVDHEPETSTVGDVCDHRQDEKVTISRRIFKAYARCPVGTANRMYQDALRACPGVPVSLSFA